MDITALSGPNVEINEKELKLYEEMALAVAAQAQDIASSIKDVESCQAAQKWCAEKMTFATNLRKTSWLAGIRDIFHKRHADICAMIKGHAEPHEFAVKTIVDPVINRFLAEQERLRRLAEEQLRAEAKKRDEEARLAHAEALDRLGHKVEADRVLSQPAQFAAPTLEPVKMAGMSQRKTWKVRELDETQAGDLTRKLELIQAVAKGAIPHKALSINYSFLNTQAKAMDGNLYDGIVECQEITSIAHKRYA